MKRSWPRRLLTYTLIVIVLALGVVWLLLRASLPMTNGQKPLPGLLNSVVVARDDLGMPTITAKSRMDLARATGYAHGQDRFFQMDLLRRSSAGELAEIFGPKALDFDRKRRLHRMRMRAQRILAHIKPGELALLAAYSAGVNQAIADLRAPPFEYLLLRQRPRQWQPEDSILAALSMYFTLQSSTARLEKQLGDLRYCLPSEVVDFIAPQGTSWDASLKGDYLPTVPIPGAELIDLRHRASVVTFDSGKASPGALPEVVMGSNNWAVSGTHTRHGSALVADDMHLGLRLPHIWYRLRLVRIATSTEPEMEITGVSLPGIPVVVVGSNSHVAWAFTNAYGDFLDLIPLRLATDDPTRYLTPEGYETLRLQKEIIRVKGSAAVSITVRETRWGPIVDKDAKGRPLVWRWLAHDAAAVDLSGLLELEKARNTLQAVAIAQKTSLPAQNFVVGDRHGDIAWTIIGQIPVRSAALTGRFPADWSQAHIGWLGLLTTNEYPLEINPAHGRIWTANSRVSDQKSLRVIGDGGYALGARAAQIRDRLMALNDVDEAAMLAIQLDDEARFLNRWRRLLLSELDNQALMAGPPRRDYRQEILHWSGRAAIDDVGYRLVREFRDRIRRRVMREVTASCVKDEETWSFEGTWQAEAPLWQLLSHRPGHFLPADVASWRQLILQEVDAHILHVAEEVKDPSEYTWGHGNRLRMSHPLSSALPVIGQYLTMPATALPGDRDMPRVQRPGFGASQRMAVTPGREKEGYMHMPGGQSAHPLSPYFSSGHNDWVQGNPTPFLPGPTVSELILMPE